MTEDELFAIVDATMLSDRRKIELKAAVRVYVKALLQQCNVSGWQEFPEQKPPEGQLIVMNFDDVRFCTLHFSD
jgi:hypothetical protein